MSSAFWLEEGAYDGEEAQGLGPWDTMLLAGQRVPGVVRWPTGTINYKLDVKRARGQVGATITQQGKDPPAFTIQILIWKMEHWTKWQQLLPLLAPKHNKPLGSPVSISHPALEAYGIAKVLVESVSLPKPIGRGAAEVSLKLREWRPAPKKVGAKTPKKSKDGSGKSDKVDELLDQFKKKFQKMKDQFGHKFADPAKSDAGPKV